MKSYLLYITLISAVFVLNAQNTNRNFKSADFDGTNLTVEVNDGIYLFKPYSSKIIETTFVPNNEIFNAKSHAVVLSPTALEVNYINEENSIKLSTKSCRLLLQSHHFKCIISIRMKS